MAQFLRNVATWTSKKSHIIFYIKQTHGADSVRLLSNQQISMSLPAIGSIAHPRARSEVEHKRCTLPLRLWHRTADIFIYSTFELRQNLSFMTDVSSLKCWLNCECLKSTCLLELKRDAKTRTPPLKNRLRFLLYRTKKTKTTVFH